MLKHKEIIEKLTPEQKLSALTDEKFLASPEAAAAGLPRLCIGRAEEKTGRGGLYPSFACAVNSWNAELLGKAAEDLAREAKERGENVLVLPASNVKSSIYANGGTEDPLLSGVLTGACASSVSAAGLAPCLSVCALSDCDVEFADIEPNQRALREYFLRPFEIAAKSVQGGGIVTSFTCLRGEYRQINIGTINDILHEGFGKDKFIFCDKTDAELAVSSICAGNPICFDGNELALDAALKNYLRLKKAAEEGKISFERVESACRGGSALSEELVDQALDSAIDFALSLGGAARSENGEGGEKKSGKEGRETALRLAEESAVLLKNENGILPFRAGGRVAIIGHAASLPEGPSAPTFAEYFSAHAEEAGLTCVGYADGYRLEEERSDPLIPAACELARQADTALLFLGFDEHRKENMSSVKYTGLPANQAALLNALIGTKVKIVAVLTGNSCVDMSFDGACAAVITAPDGACGAEALTRLLTGKSNPSGKLAATLYDGGDEIFEMLKSCKDRRENKAGTFFGYRYYDTAGKKVRYPFGFGLSYTRFEYSGLKVFGEELRFTLKNAGRADGGEIVQVYAGKPDSAVIRPLKELKGFRKVYLRAGESREVCIRLDKEDFAVYDEEGKKATEFGRYRVYVGASVSDVRLSAEIFLMGSRLTSKKETLSDYLQTESNIVSGGYVMETSDKNGDGLKLKKFAKISVTAAAVFDVLVALLALASGIWNWDFDPFEDGSAILSINVCLLFLLNALMAVSLAAVFLNGRRRKKLFEAECRRKAFAAKEERVAEEQAYAKLFEEEFGPAEREEAPVSEAEEAADENRADLSDGITAEELCGRFSAFCAERGISADISTARAVFSAMSVSRLVFLKSDAADLLPAFSAAVAEFFGCPTFADDTAGYACPDDALTGTGGHGANAETALVKALTFAETSKECVCVACLNNVSPAGMGAWFSRFSEYVLDPEKGYSVCPTHGETPGKSYSLASNVWFFAALAEGGRTDELPPLPECGAFADVSLSRCDKSADAAPFRPVGFRSFTGLGEECGERFELGEEYWKKIDKLERYANEVLKSGYKIGHVTWQRLERYVGVFLACGGEEREATDGAVAAILLPKLLSLFKERNCEDEGEFVRALEDIFGEENITQCRRAAERNGAAS